MPNEKLRRQLAWDAAQLLRAGDESQYAAARMKAVRRLGSGWVPEEDLPTDAEIRDLVNTPTHVGEGDRFDLYRTLLLPLEQVKLNPEYHPEGDCLFHVLQVFELARHERPFDEEFLLAALLHDVGKAIDRRAHIAAGLTALGDSITPRTAWLIEHHSEANQLVDGTLGARAKRRLEAHEDFDTLMLLSRCDRGGRSRQANVLDVEEALDVIRQLEADHGE